jgi:hypothetical protein
LASLSAPPTRRSGKGAQKERERLAHRERERERDRERERERVTYKQAIEPTQAHTRTHEQSRLQLHSRVFASVWGLCMCVHVSVSVGPVVSVRAASTMIWTMWARTSITTPSLKCSAIGHSATTSRHVCAFVCLSLSLSLSVSLSLWRSLTHCACGADAVPPSSPSPLNTCRKKRLTWHGSC